MCKHCTVFFFKFGVVVLAYGLWWPHFRELIVNGPFLRFIVRGELSESLFLLGTSCCVPRWACVVAEMAVSWSEVLALAAFLVH
jgi:hypothetical protein